jgi:hypothetical protein
MVSMVPGYLPYGKSNSKEMLNADLPVVAENGSWIRFSRFAGARVRTAKRILVLLLLYQIVPSSQQLGTEGHACPFNFTSAPRRKM